MPALYEIRADYDADSIVVYQAYGDSIAQPALESQRFVAPFSVNRMTWLKPSFLWLMHRSNWGRKSGQQRTLAVRITRQGWEEALSVGVLTAPVPKLHGSAAAWQELFRKAHVHVQWDPERSLRGAALDHYSIQVGLSRFVIGRFVDEWVVSIQDLTPTVDKIRRLLRDGRASKAKRFLPNERIYTLPPAVARRFMIDDEARA